MLLPRGNATARIRGGSTGCAGTPNHSIRMVGAFLNLSSARELYSTPSFAPRSALLGKVVIYAFSLFSLLLCGESDPCLPCFSLKQHLARSAEQKCISPSLLGLAAPPRPLWGPLAGLRDIRRTAQKDISLSFLGRAVSSPFFWPFDGLGRPGLGCLGDKAPVTLACHPRFVGGLTARPKKKREISSWAVLRTRG